MKNIRNKKLKRNITLSRGQRILASTIMITTGVFLFFSYSIYSRIQTEKVYTRARVYGESVAAGIEISLNQSLNTTEMIKELYLEYDDIFIRDFNRMCKRLVDSNAVIGSLYLAPDAIIQCAYPEDIAKSTIGFEMLKDPEQAEKALLAIETGKITVAGPHKLVEGGNGFIIRNPIFKDGKFTAFSIVVLNWDEFVKQILNKVSRENSGYKFGVWKNNDVHAITDEYGFIFKNNNEDVSKNIRIKIKVPNDTWYLSVEPISGWKKATENKKEAAFCIILFLCVTIFGFARQYEHARKLFFANHDELTGLLQRAAFLKRVEEIRKDDPDVKYTVIAADIKNFKVINAMYGTEKSDELLRYLGNIFEKMNETGISSRYGGDQFMCIFPTDKENMTFEVISKNAKTIIDNAPVQNLNIKYGIYEDIDPAVNAVRCCDRALLAARSIRDSYDEIFSNYEGSVSKYNMRKQTIESSFLEALESKSFKVWLQPKFDAVTEKVIGAEALVRWIRPDGTAVSPADFIGIFEEDGLIYRLDEYVFKWVCEAMKHWQDKGYSLLPISVNVSRVSLKHPNIVKEYKKIIESFGIDKSAVPIEITESADSDAKETRRLAQEFKDNGFMIHMDDFGSGFSSLGNLNSMPFDEIKLDKSLIDYIGTPDGDELLRHILSLIQFKGLKTIAEGVETKEQLDFLKALKCNHIQGYYFSAPLSYEKFLAFLKENMDL